MGEREPIHPGAVAELRNYDFAPHGPVGVPKADLAAFEGLFQLVRMASGGCPLPDTKPSLLPGGGCGPRGGSLGGGGGSGVRHGDHRGGSSEGSAGAGGAPATIWIYRHRCPRDSSRALQPWSATSSSPSSTRTKSLWKTHSLPGNWSAPTRIARAPTPRTSSATYPATTRPTTLSA